MKLKTKPSDKIHRRYLLVLGNKREIENVLLDSLGEIGFAKAMPFFVSEFEGKTVLAVERNSLNKVKSKLKTIKTSGTLKGLNRKVSRRK